MKQRVFKNHHLHTFQSTMDLRYSLREQGKYSEAESRYRQTLRRRMEVLGIDHPITLASTSHPTHSLDQQDKYAEAEAIQR